MSDSLSPEARDAHDALAADGAFARALEGFAPRASQQQMAAAVADAIADGEDLVVEAGTGTGKTFAYLVPALQAGCRTVVSTGTRHLQDQLFHRDLPLVCEALGRRPRLALLKGRANYLCPHRLAVALGEGRPMARREQADLERIRDWAGRTREGDIAELGGIPEGSPLWPRVTSTTDNCLGSDCPAFGDCFVLKARRRAQEADLVVVNHHLLLADMALREEGFGELLPGAELFIVDEAHQLAETATGFFGHGLSARQLNALARDAVLEHLAEAGDMAGISEAAQQLERAVAELRLALGESGQRLPWRQLAGRPQVRDALAATGEALEALRAWLEAAAPRGRGLENCWQRAERAARVLKELDETPPEDFIVWLETFRRGFAVHFTPLEVGSLFQQHRAGQEASWVFTSATLAVGERFIHFCERLALDSPRTLRLESPFDYARNTLLWLPEGLPQPNEPGYDAAALEIAREALAASGGRAFLLFTSHRALRHAAEVLREDCDYPLLVQGDAPRSELLARFRRAGNAVLLGTSSFWEGVDVRGEALSLVWIDRLPFASPGDPVLQAHIDRLRAAGGNPFMEFQVPNAVIALKQGVGRLIRDVTDRGVLVLCDPRLLGKPYGRVFRNSLPPMPVTRSADAVRAFFAPQAIAGGQGA